MKSPSKSWEEISIPAREKGTLESKFLRMVNLYPSTHMTAYRYRVIIHLKDNMEKMKYREPTLDSVMQSI